MKTWHVVIACLVAAVMTAAIIRESMAQGRLSLPPTFDDVFYMVDGIKRLQTLDQQGVRGLVSGCISSPPHSPLSTVFSVLGFAIFGVHEWAPYVLNGLLLLLILTFTLYLCRGLPNMARWACFAAVACTPFAVMSVHEFRPDMANGALIAIGLILLLDPDRGGRPRTTAVLAGASLGAAMLAKPTAFPLTLMATGVGAGLRAFVDWRPDRTWQNAMRAVRVPIIAVLSLVAVAGPYYLVAGHDVWGYIQYNLHGAGSTLWIRPMTRVEHARYYIDGEGRRFMQGPYAYAVLALAPLGAAVSLFAHDRARFAREFCLLVLMLVLYAISAIVRLKYPFFGCPFQALLIFLSVASVASVGARLLRGPPAHRLLAGAFPMALALGAVVTFRWPTVWGPPTGPYAVTLRQSLSQVNTALRESAPNRTPRVLLTFTGGISSSLLEWCAWREGATLEARSNELCDKVKDYAPLLKWADTVLACDSGTGLTVDSFPSAAAMDDMVRYLDRQPNWEQLATIAVPDSRAAFHLYRKRPPAPRQATVPAGG